MGSNHENQKAVNINKIFADREEPRESFWNRYAQMSTPSEKKDDVHVINYFGYGGVGKTDLLKKLIMEMEGRIQNPHYLYLDFKETQDPRSVLNKMRNCLKSKYHFSFPHYDYAVQVYNTKVGNRSSSDEVKSIVDHKQKLAFFIDVLSTLPTVGTAAVIAKWGLKKFAVHQSESNNTRFQSHDLLNKMPDEILNSLQYYFAIDLKNCLEKSSEPFVVFFDTYEMLVNELSSVGEATSNDQWLRNPNNGLISNVPNVLWVIAGREPLQWKKYDDQWKCQLHQSSLENLPLPDAELYLKNAEITDETLRKEILAITHGLPSYLDLYVENYHQVRAVKENPTIHDLGKDISTMYESFLKYMDETKKDMVFLLACMGTWSKNELIDAAREILPNFSYSALEKIETYSFIITEDHKNYKMQQVMKDILYQKAYESIKKKTNTYMEKSLYGKLNDLSEKDPQYTDHIRRYLTFKLRNIDCISSFADFYNNEYSGFYDKLFGSYQFHELGDFQQTIIRNIPKNINNYHLLGRIYLDHALVLLHGRDYYNARLFSDKAVDVFRDGEGIHHENTLFSLSIKLLSCFYLCDQKETVKLAREIESLFDDMTQKKDAFPVFHLIILEIVATVYSLLGEKRDALRLAGLCLELFQTVLGVKHPDTVNSMGTLASIQMRVGQNNEALAMAKQSVELSKEVFGIKHPDTVSAMDLLLDIYKKAGNTEGALELAEEVLKLRKEMLGEKNPKTIESMSQLAKVYVLAGREKHALSVEAQVLEIKKDLYEEMHPEIIESMSNLSIFHYETGDLSKALDLGEQSLSLSKEYFGENSPQTSSVMDNLSTYYLQSGNHDKALRIAEEALQLKKDYHGENAPETIDSMMNLARAYNELGDYEKSVELAKRCLKYREKHLGAQHFQTIETMDTLACFYTDAGRCFDAINLTKRVVELRKKHSGENHPQTIDTMETLSLLHHHTGNYDAAIKLAKKVVDQRMQVDGESNELTIKAMERLISLYSAADKISEAIDLTKRVVGVRIKHSGENHPQSINAMETLFSLHHHVGNDDGAIKLATKVLDLRMQVDGGNNKQTIDVMESLSLLHHHAGNNDGAIDLAKKVLALRLQTGAEDDPETIATMISLSNFYSYADKHSEAIDLGKTAVQLSIKKSGVNHPQTIDSIEDLSLFYHDAGNYDNAIYLAEKVLELRMETKGQDDPETIDCMELLSSFYVSAGNYKKAYDFSKRVLKYRQKAFGDEDPQTVQAERNVDLIYSKYKNLDADSSDS